jgi:hypothetical protein
MTEPGNHSIIAAAAGPILYARGSTDTEVHLAAIAVGDETWQPPPLVPEGGPLVAPAELARDFGWIVWRYDFALPRQRGGASYAMEDRAWRVQTDPSPGALRIAYTACNGKEHDDLFDPHPERNAVWRKLLADHRENPFALLLQGGDQLYADNVWDCHDELRRWDHESDATRLRRDLSDEARRAVRRFYWSAYITLWGQADLAPVLAEVPSLMMWDDHDIFDGWGSHADPYQQCPIWRAVYAAAREAFALFQLGAGPDRPPAMCARTGGHGFSWHCRFGDVAVVAPDLRSERTPQRVMADGGWTFVDGWPRDLADCSHVFVMSSVPALGPRLSWAERILHLIPGAQSYEDDLRDQWQSRAHRAEWQRFLRACLDLMAAGPRVTLLSGEIHLATRGYLQTAGDAVHQLVASGVAHPPPSTVYARGLGALARLGESPLPDHPIGLRPLPGRRRIYTADRNYLVLERGNPGWRAWWVTEHDGATPALPLD